MVSANYTAERWGNNVKVRTGCSLCKKPKEFEVPLQEWWNFIRNPGKKIQETLVSATPGERELLLTGFCDDCFKASVSLDSEREAMNIWMYYETDGDSGYYGVRLFATEATAQRYREKQRGNAYGHIKSMEVRP